MGVLRVRSTAVPRQSLRSIFRANRRGAAAIIDGIAVPWQCPPQIFIDAVLVCPPITGMAYERALLANGGRNLVGPMVHGTLGAAADMPDNQRGSAIIARSRDWPKQQGAALPRPWPRCLLCWQVVLLKPAPVGDLILPAAGTR